MLVSLIMIFLAIVMCLSYGQFKSSGAVWGRPLAGLLGLITTVIAVVQIHFALNASSKLRQNIISTEQRYAEVSMEYLGDYLARNFTGERILIVRDPTTNENKTWQDLTLKAFKKGLNKELSIVAHESPEFPVKDSSISEDRVIEDYELTSAALESMIERHPHCTMVVSLIGAPHDIENIKNWTLKSGERPKLVTANADVSYLKQLIKGGLITVATANNWEQHDLTENVPAGIDDAFNKRCILINKNNIDLLERARPRLFKEL